MTFAAITGFRLVTADPERLAAFYRAVGFTVGEVHPIGEDEMRLLGVSGGGFRLPLALGNSQIALDWFVVPGRPYPGDTSAADTIFQHLALVIDDADAAWQAAATANATPIGRGGPVTLPASSGGVTAIKFRDPDGHPLEFLQFPAGSNANWRGGDIMGIGHSAITVADVEASKRFYRDHGLSEGTATLNEGPTQAALDGLDDVRVDVVPMRPTATPPHLELLGYRHPAGRSHTPLAANDIAATRIVWRADRNMLIRDPDGHLHQFSR